MSMPCIAFVTGGYSGEAVVSYASAITIQQHLDTAKFNVYRIDITPSSWFHKMEDGTKVTVDKNDFSLNINGNTIVFDGVLIGIHGTPGEDGKLQGYFDMLGLPYSSCDTSTSAITFNKKYTTAVAAASGINTAKSIIVFQYSPLTVDHILQHLSLPLFVKPNNGGSSIGISRVNNREDLAPAIERAFKEDNQILLEEFISGREFTIGIYRKNNEIIPLPFTEILTENEFFDYEAKYSGKSKEITPADCTPSLTLLVKQTATSLYELFNCRGVIRIDFIYNEASDKLYLLEINTVPGQSAASIVPQQVRAMGMDLMSFYTSLIEEMLPKTSKP
jgi:D-alanine-D-alanine ligase